MDRAEFGSAYFWLDGVAIQRQITNIVHMKTVGRHYSKSMLTTCVLAVVCPITTPLNGHAATSNYTSLATFASVVGPQSLIRFTEVPLGTAPTDEYASYGVRFVYDANNETESDPGAYLTDSIGLAGGREGYLTFISFVFDNPVHSLGVDFPGALHIDLFSGNTLVGASANFGDSGSGFSKLFWVSTGSVPDSRRKTSPSARMTPRSMTFCSSRIFPGHE